MNTLAEAQRERAAAETRRELTEIAYELLQMELQDIPSLREPSRTGDEVDDLATQPPPQHNKRWIVFAMLFAICCAAGGHYLMKKSDVVEGIPVTISFQDAPLFWSAKDEDLLDETTPFTQLLPTVLVTSLDDALSPAHIHTIEVIEQEDTFGESASVQDHITLVNVSDIRPHTPTSATQSGKTTTAETAHISQPATNPTKEDDQETQLHNIQTQTPLQLLLSQVNLAKIAQSGDATLLQDLDSLGALTSIMDVNEFRSFTPTGLRKVIALHVLLMRRFYM